MDGNVLLDKSQVPDEEILKSSMSDNYRFYTSINEMTDEYEKDWKFCGNKYGWKYKIHSDDKTLLEITVLTKSILTVIAIRNSEWEDIQNSEENAPLKMRLSESKVKTESYGIKINICDETSFDLAQALIKYLVTKRGL